VDIYIRACGHLWSYVAELFLEWECFRRTSKHTFFVRWHFSANRAVYRIMWTKYCIAGEVTYGNTIRRMLFACWIPKVTIIHSEYITYCYFTATMVAPTRLSFRFCLSYCVLMRRFISSVSYQKDVTKEEQFGKAKKLLWVFHYPLVLTWLPQLSLYLDFISFILLIKHSNYVVITIKFSPTKYISSLSLISKHLHCWFQTFAVYWMFYVFFWVIPRRLKFM